MPASPKITLIFVEEGNLQVIDVDVSALHLQSPHLAIILHNIFFKLRNHRFHFF